MTKGEQRVKIDYVKSEKDLSYEIKKKTAELIDLCEEMKDMRQNEPSGEKQRLISIAQTNYETAAMYAVKARFTE